MENIFNFEIQKNQRGKTFYISMAEVQDKLNNLIKKKADKSNKSTADIRRDMGEKAGIDKDTVDNIITRGIKCPPIERLKGFAQALDVSEDTIINLFKDDGCNYTDKGFTKRNES